MSKDTSCRLVESMLRNLEKALWKELVGIAEDRQLKNKLALNPPVAPNQKAPGHQPEEQLV